MHYSFEILEWFPWENTCNVGKDIASSAKLASIIQAVPDYEENKTNVC